MGSKTRTNRILESLNGAKDSLQSLTDLWQSHDATWESSPNISPNFEITATCLPFLRISTEPFLRT